jgi:hypothetical protein
MSLKQYIQKTAYGPQATPTNNNDSGTAYGSYRNKQKKTKPVAPTTPKPVVPQLEPQYRPNAAYNKKLGEALQYMHKHKLDPNKIISDSTGKITTGAYIEGAGNKILEKVTGIKPAPSFSADNIQSGISTLMSGGLDPAEQAKRLRYANIIQKHRANMLNLQNSGSYNTPEYLIPGLHTMDTKVQNLPRTIKSKAVNAVVNKQSGLLDKAAPYVDLAKQAAPLAKWAAMLGIPLMGAYMLINRRGGGITKKQMEQLIKGLKQNNNQNNVFRPSNYRRSV